MSLKYSRQREAIRGFLLTRKDHPTADVVYENVRTVYPNISRGTVYRNLSLLLDLGEIRMIAAGDGRQHFDGNAAPHDHFICRNCGAVMDIDYGTDRELEERASEKFEGRIEGHEVLYYGLCRDCLEKAGKEKPEKADSSENGK